MKCLSMFFLMLALSPFTLIHSQNFNCDSLHSLPREESMIDRVIDIPHPLTPLDFTEFWSKIDPAEMHNRIFVVIVIDTLGNALCPKIQKGNNNETDAAALEFASKLKFTPGVDNGRKIPVRISIPFPKPDVPLLKKPQKI